MKHYIRSVIEAGMAAWIAFYAIFPQNAWLAEEIGLRIMLLVAAAALGFNCWLGVVMIRTSQAQYRQFLKEMEQARARGKFQ